MCYIFNKDRFVPKLAEEDLHVFKVGTCYSGNFMSPVTKTPYSFGEEKRVPEFWKNVDTTPFDEIITQRGLYSIGSEETAKEYLRDSIRRALRFSSFRMRIFIATIPKGSYYIKTENDYIISDCLIVHNKILDWYPELGKEFLEEFKDKLAPYVPENILSGTK